MYLMLLSHMLTEISNFKHTTCKETRRLINDRGHDNLRKVRDKILHTIKYTSLPMQIHHEAYSRLKKKKLA